MTVRHKIKKQVSASIAKLWPGAGEIGVVVDRPPHEQFGDYSITIALQLARVVKEDPIRIAESIAASLVLPEASSVKVVPPGFVNITFSDEYCRKLPSRIIAAGREYAKQTIGKGAKVNIEFISANPTGPLTLANGRGGFYGDALGNCMAKMGYEVTREYYVNDMGNQVTILAESVLRKYFTLQGIPMEYPEYCYQGEYVHDLAKDLRIPNYNLAKHPMEEIRDAIKDKIIAKMMRAIRDVIEKKMRIHFDMYFSERKLYAAQGDIERTLARLRELDLVYANEGATWMKTTAFGDDKDRVLIKANGEYTYLLPDIAYHLNKFEVRQFDMAIDVFGADHNAGRMYAAMQAFGHKEKLAIILMQMVRLLQDGKEVKMSKRKGTYVEIEELLDEVGTDVARFFFLMYAPTTHMDFDLTLAKEKSEKNPVFYVQYAHARMCSILTMVDKKGIKHVKTSSELAPETRRLALMLVRWPDVVEDAVRDRGVHRLPQYAIELARTFHEFYGQQRILSHDGTVNEALLKMVIATKTVLADALSMMGVGAPERM